MNKPTAVRQRTRKQGSEGTIVKQASHVVSGETVSEAQTVERMPNVCDDPNPAYVGVTGAVTKQPVKFESVKVQVSISLPCPATEQAIRETYDRASLLVEEFVGIELENAMQQHGGGQFE